VKITDIDGHHYFRTVIIFEVFKLKRDILWEFSAQKSRENHASVPFFGMVIIELWQFHRSIGLKHLSGLP
jgi:hypothetical protein